MLKAKELVKKLLYLSELFFIFNLTAQVSATDVKPRAAVLSTNVLFTFDPQVQKRVEEFVVEVYTDLSTPSIISIPPTDRMATFKRLKPNTRYTARVLTVYKDVKERIESSRHSFNTPGI